MEDFYSPKAQEIVTQWQAAYSSNSPPPNLNSDTRKLLAIEYLRISGWHADEKDQETKAVLNAKQALLFAVLQDEAIKDKREKPIYLTSEDLTRIFIRNVKNQEENNLTNRIMLKLQPLFALLRKR